MPHDHKNPTPLPLVQDILPLYLFHVDYRDKKIGREKLQCPAEPGLRNTDDGKRMLVELNDLVHHRAITLKMVLPVPVAEHDVRSAVRSLLIGGVEETAKKGLNT